MKKGFVWLLVFVMLLPTLAYAGGLGGLGGSGGGLGGLMAGEAGVVPDPAEVLGKAGQVLQENYQFAAGYVCTAYTYPLPRDTAAFVADYTAAAQRNGFAVEQVTVDGFEGYKLYAPDNRYALLVPEFNGSVLLLVQNGMEFGSARPDGFYLKVKRNGRELVQEYGSRELSCEETTRSIGTSKSFTIKASFERAAVSYMILSFPNRAQAGDEFVVDRDSLMDGMYFYTTEEGSMVFYDSQHHHRMESGKDYFRVKITDMYTTDDGLVIEGVFDGSFARGDIVYSDGSFRVLCDE